MVDVHVSSSTTNNLLFHRTRIRKMTVGKLDSISAFQMKMRFHVVNFAFYVEVWDMKRFHYDDNNSSVLYIVEDKYF